MLLKYLIFVTVFAIFLYFESSFSTFQQFKFSHNSDFYRNTIPAKSPRLVVNVDDFGAKANGRDDDSQAFLRAWEKVCFSNKQSVLLVPARKDYYVKPINFKGPCKAAGITMKVHGTISASKHMPDYANNTRLWLKFKKIKNFTLEGGIFNGNGQIWWPQSCKSDKTKPCKTAATALTFDQCQNLKVKRITIKDAQQMHLTFDDCMGVEASHIKVNTNAKSPNTDGIHLTGTRNIHISHCDIQTGDDCISIVSGSHNVTATHIKCGPGHGISIGGLGKNGAKHFVSNILVNRAIISGTDNGLRIKSWQGGRGIAENIIFENIDMQNVRNPIIINQYYCDKNGKDCPVQREAVQIRNVVFKNIRGTTAENKGIVFNCSRTVLCEEIKLQNVHLTYQGNNSTTAYLNAKAA